MKAFITGIFVYLISTLGVSAQSSVWIQIEAQPTQSAAEDRARAYAAELPDVAGFSLRSGWHAIVLGPYAQQDAVVKLAQLRSARQIPTDSFVAFSSSFAQQFWPNGSTVSVTPLVESTQSEAPAVAVETVEVAEPVVPDETPNEARRSERLLSAEERQGLQIALRWAGFYNAAIDGAFGPGTRGSMRAWQEENGYEGTGILTTRQRVELLAQYNAVLDGMDLTLVENTEAGISMQMPLGVVEFSRYDAPFVHYDSTGDVPAQVILISQSGDQNTLFGLYDILQTLSVVPLEGPRQRGSSGFEITGLDATHHTYVRATLSDGAVKGFILVWPAGDTARRDRVLAEVNASFQTIDGVLPDDRSSGGQEQRIDLVSGLEIRRPILSRTGFYVNDTGAVVTTSEIAQTCSRITLDENYDATLVASDAASGIAVLTPQDRLAPPAVAAFRETVGQIQSEIAVSGYSYEGVLGAPSMTFGTLADIRGLQGEDDKQRLVLPALPGDAGGPVVDSSGAVLGMLLPRDQGGRQLPDGANFATKATPITDLLTQNQIAFATRPAASGMAPEDLTTMAGAMTVLVSCWN